jgi:hypothetical protein
MTVIFCWTNVGRGRAGQPGFYGLYLFRCWQILLQKSVEGFREQ